MSEKKAILEVRGLGIDFGGLRAVNNFSMKVEERQLYGLIGPNGAGKTTVFNMLTGVYEPGEGEILLDGERVNGQKPYLLTRKGIARTFQNIRLFKGMTVRENVMVALDKEADYSLWNGLWRLPGSVAQERKISEEALRLLEIFQLKDDADKPAGSLPYGKQRELEIARALGTRPKLLLLDEPAAGMNPQETLALMEAIRKVRDTFGIAVLLIEHDMKLVMGICERISVLNYGMLLAEGTPEEILSDREVIKAYLGE